MRHLKEHFIHKQKPIFIRYSRTELEETDSFTPKLRDKNHLEEGALLNYYKALENNGFPSVLKCVHMMDERTATSASYGSLYGENKYGIGISDDQKIAWTFILPINDWFYKVDRWVSDFPSKIPKSDYGKMMTLKLKDTPYNIDKDYEDLTYKDCDSIIKTLKKEELIGIGTLKELMMTDLYHHKENLFVWTGESVSIKKSN